MTSHPPGQSRNEVTAQDLAVHPRGRGDRRGAEPGYRLRAAVVRQLHRGDEPGAAAVAARHAVCGTVFRHSSGRAHPAPATRCASLETTARFAHGPAGDDTGTAGDVGRQLAQRGETPGALRRPVGDPAAELSRRGTRRTAAKRARQARPVYPPGPRMHAVGGRRRQPDTGRAAAGGSSARTGPGDPEAPAQRGTQTHLCTAPAAPPLRAAR